MTNELIYLLIVRYLYYHYFSYIRVANAPIQTSLECLSPAQSNSLQATDHFPTVKTKARTEREINPKTIGPAGDQTSQSYSQSIKINIYFVMIIVI